MELPLWLIFDFLALIMTARSSVFVKTFFFKLSFFVSLKHTCIITQKTKSQREPVDFSLFPLDRMYRYCLPMFPMSYTGETDRLEILGDIEIWDE